MTNARTTAALSAMLLGGMLLLVALVLVPANMPAAATLAPVTVAAPAVPAADNWRAMTFEQRHEHMTFVVHPILMERWQTHYQTAAPQLRCVSCHGEQAERHRYQMAFTPLDGLQPSRVQALYRSAVEPSDEQRFKRDVVTPLMADLLGVPRYDAATGQGFSCFGCHPRETE